MLLVDNIWPLCGHDHEHRRLWAGEPGLERERPRLHFPAQTSTGQPRRLRSSHTPP